MRERDELDEHMGVHRGETTHCEHEFLPGQDSNHRIRALCPRNKEMCISRSGDREGAHRKKDTATKQSTIQRMDVALSCF